MSLKAFQSSWSYSRNFEKTRHSFQVSNFKKKDLSLFLSKEVIICNEYVSLIKRKNVE